MKRFAISLTLALTCSILAMTAAEAKRFGGGSSIGKQRTFSQQQLQTPARAAPGAGVPPQPAQPAPTGSRWGGPLAGLMLGLGLGTLFEGFGGGLGTILLIVAAIVVIRFLFAMFRAQTAPGYAGGMPPGARPQQAFNGPPVNASTRNIPAGFPVEAFLRGARTSFIRLQAANDRKDLNDIREYTTPEMFAEISMQLRERDDTAQRTDVLALDTDLLEVVTEGDYAIASVRMRGELRENNGAPESFDEVWNVQKDLRDDRSAWLLSGIQQIA